MSQIKYILRDLPGISAIEARMKRINEHPNPNWAPENDGLQEEIDRISTQLFGITQRETLELTYEDLGLTEDDPPHEDVELALGRFSQHFQFLDGQASEDDALESAAQLVWGALGWEVTDKDGEELECLMEFERQIVCAAKGLKGRLPDAEMSDSEASDQAARWGEQFLKSWQKTS